MFEKSINLAVLLMLLLTIISCSETTELDINANRMTLEEIKATPGFDWYELWFDDYQPDQSVINQISATFDSSLHEFVLFSKPQCKCTDEQKMFPNALKVLMEAGVTESNIEIFSMLETKGNHPYMDVLKVNTIPGIYIFKNNVPVYSVVDTINYKKIVSPSTEIILEQEILDGMK